MARKQDIVRSAERYASFLLYEATGGAMGRAPVGGKKASENDFKLDFQTKRALLDSLIKLAGLKAKVTPDDDEDGIQNYKDMLNAGSGENIDRGATEPPAAGDTTPAVRPGTNGRDTHDFLE